MKYKIQFTGPAKHDLEAVTKYITEELKNKDAAKNLVLLSREAAFSLEEMPSRNALVRDEALAGQGLRLLPVRNYLIFYVVREEAKTVTIERFLYGRRDWMNILKAEAPTE
ncbi:MAG: type II toxin-antitoxin system RelE/ParE family toxin [Oscillospiraceae bacterium]|jgi:toxin ParE1/3/4|nr:type II toxin-antitoxin system RelE/ParE family toxin [Oscillospiraceae bacterium]